MDLVAAAQVIMRRWPVFAAGLLVTALALGGLFLKLPNTYSADATVLLLVPSTGGVYTAPDNPAKPPPPKIANPYLNFDQSLDVIAKVVADGLSTEDAKQGFQAKGFAATYEIVLQPGGPLVSIKATDRDPQMALSTRDAVVKAFEADVTDRQRSTGVPSSTWATTQALNMGAPKITSSKVKTLGLAAGLGVAAAISVVFIVEGLVGARRTSGFGAPPGSYEPRRTRREPTAQGGAGKAPVVSGASKDDDRIWLTGPPASSRSAQPPRR